MPIALYEAVDPMERPQVARQTVERIVAAEDLIELRDLLGEGHSRPPPLEDPPF